MATGQRSYTTEFKEEVIKLAQEKGAKQAAKEKNVPEDTVYTWLHRAKKGDLTGNKADSKENNIKINDANEQLKEAKKKIKMLEQENAQLKKERDILEGATTFFATRQKQ